MERSSPRPNVDTSVHVPLARRRKANGHADHHTHTCFWCGDVVNCNWRECHPVDGWVKITQPCCGDEECREQAEWDHRGL